MKRIADFESVVEAYKQLKDQNEPTTVKNIISISGGSTTTVTPLVRRYEEQLHKEQSLAYSISPTFREAYICDVHSAVSHATQELERERASLLIDGEKQVAELRKTEEQIIQLNDLLKQRQQEIGDLQQRLQTEKATAIQQISILEKHQERAIADTKVAQESLDKLRSKHAKGEAVMELGKKEAEKSNQMCSELQRRNEDLNREIARLDKQYAVTEEKLNSAQSQNEQYRNRIDELKAAYSDLSFHRNSKEQSLSQTMSNID
jgi:chromosome segregation ATPase